MRTKHEFAGLLLLFLAGAVCAGDWPQWRGPHRDSTAEVLSISAQTTFKEVWRAEVGTGFSSLAIVQSRLYTMGNRDDQDTIWCLDAQTGKPLWQYAYSAPLDPNLFEGGPTATPTVQGDDVFVLSRQGQVFHLEAGTGSVRWQIDLTKSLNYDVPSWGYSSSPVVLNDRVLLNVGSHGVAVDRASGEVLWKSSNGEEAGYATPTLFQQQGRQLILVMSSKNANAVDPATGELAWQHRWITRYGVNAADPYPFDGYVLLSSGYGKGSALLKLTEGAPEELWRTRELRNQLSPGILRDGHVFAVDGDAGSDCELICFSIQDQSRTWSYSGLGSATLLQSGNNLLVLSDGGELVIAPLDTREFKPIVRQHVIDGKCWTMPAVAHGRIYIRNAEGAVVCLSIHSP